jgi:hypothetical protein
MGHDAFEFFCTMLSMFMFSVFRCHAVTVILGVKGRVCVAVFDENCCANNLECVSDSYKKCLIFCF